MIGTYPWILMEDCIDGHLYVISARNSSLGIYVKAKQAFIISRHKFNSNFLDEEDHWDTGEPHGTAKPLLILSEAPHFSNDEEKLEYLNRCDKELEDVVKTAQEVYFNDKAEMYKDSKGVTRKWIWNPKTRGSGVITCIPQTGFCPNGCMDCFFQSGRSYLEPLNKNLPHIPHENLAAGRIVRMNDGNDSNVDRDLVEETAKKYESYFFNTSIPKDLKEFSGPVVLTVNPGDMTDTDFHVLDRIPDNLMFIRIRTCSWNLETVVEPAIKYYTRRGVAVVLTYMAYYTEDLPKGHDSNYIWAKRTTNSYWVLKPEVRERVEVSYKDNPLVYSCGDKGKSVCSYCGTCIREYYNAMERLAENAKRIPVR